MAPQTAISKAVCYKTKNEQLWEKAVHFLLVATNWFYASLPTVFCTITKILIDNGHGHNTPGKRSPDGKFLEYAYTREIARQVVTELKNKGYDSELLVPEDDDIPLSERVRRTNAHCTALGKTNVILISIHVNAAGDGTKWMNATGWSCYTCKGQTESDRLADCLYKAAEQILENQVIRTDYARDGDPDWEENFYILRHSLCPAVLVEQFFMDNKKDLAYLISNEGKRNLIDVIVGGLEVFCSLSFPFHEH